MTTTETRYQIAEEESTDSVDVKGTEEIVIPPTPAVRTALITIITVVTTLIELGVSVAVIAGIAYALQTLVR